MSVNVLIASPYLSTLRGNSLTTLRIIHYLNKLNINAQSIDYNDCNINVCSQVVDNCDVIHILNPVRYLISEMYRAKLHIGKNYGITFTGTDVNMHLDADNIELKNLLKSANFVAVFHEQSYQKVLEVFPELQPNLHIVYQGFFASIERYNNLEVNNKNTIKNENLLIKKIKELQEDGDIVAILPAGIRKVKGVTHAIKLIGKYIRESGNQIKLLIVGPVIEAEEMKSINVLISSLDYVHYYNEMPHSQLLEAIKQADILLNSSESEGQSIAIIEAFYLGTPVIASRCVGNEQMIEHNINGFLYDTYGQFFEALNIVINDSDKVDIITKTAYEQAVINYSAEKEAQKYLSLYINGSV
jgi:glycosyltransferase involved in cell wall biosynthesis